MMKKGVVFMGMGFELLGLILGALFLGQTIDKHFGWPGYGVAIMVVVVMVSWMYHLIVLLKRFMDEDSPDDTNAIRQ